MRPFRLVIVEFGASTLDLQRALIGGGTEVVVVGQTKRELPLTFALRVVRRLHERTVVAGRTLERAAVFLNTHIDHERMVARGVIGRALLARARMHSGPIQVVFTTGSDVDAAGRGRLLTLVESLVGTSRSETTSIDLRFAGQSMLGD